MHILADPRVYVFLAMVVFLQTSQAAQQGDPKAVTAKAGTISHTVFGFKALQEIPASWTLKKYSNIARPKLPLAGHIWYVIKGSTTNNSSDERSFTSSTLVIEDAAGNKFRPRVAMSMYQPKETAIKYQKLAPGQTKKWLAFFMVAVTSKGLKLTANNLKTSGRKTVRFDLPDPTRYANAGTAPPPVAAPVQKPPPRAATSVAPATTASGGRSAKVGAIHHVLTNVEMLNEIPASRLQGRWKQMNRSAPAPKGLVWYYLQGTATNNDKSTRTVTVESVVIVDAKNTVYESENNKISYYVDPNKILSVVRMKPGETGAWETYIAAPPLSAGTRVRVTDLKYKSRRFGYLALTADGPSGPPASGQSPAMVPDKKVATRAATPASASNSGPQKSSPPRTQSPAKPDPPAVLTKIDNKDMGFTILVPKGADVALKTKGNIVYQYRKSPQFLQVSVLDNRLGTFEGAEKMATANGVKKIQSTQKIDNGLLLITQPFGVMQDVWIFKNGRKKKLIANCMGRSSGFQDLMKMCQSLTVD